MKSSIAPCIAEVLLCPGEGTATNKRTEHEGTKVGSGMQSVLIWEKSLRCLTDQHFLLTIAARAAPQQNNQKSSLDNSYIYREESDLAIRLARGAV